ncbi:MAG: CCA tRNA nucleotidyltransferase [Phycisphaerales bacterium]|nr:CCA tRNA nucleotidyltransferase [Phycisphaerales bacterium]
MSGATDAPGAESPRRVMTPHEAAYAVAGRLRDRGHVAYFAGGCVRDSIMGLDPTDYDIATSATPEEIRAVFRSSRGVGESFGVMLVTLGGRTIEVATFRTEGAYADGRRPSQVEFGDAQRDALRRDFSINGLFQDPATGEVIDFVGGKRDIEARVLRAIENPDRRMCEDRLRTLRAARFAARFSLSIDPATEAAVTRYAHDLMAVSRERIGVEIRRMMDHHTRAHAAELVERWRLDAGCLIEPSSTGSLARLAGVGPSVPLFASLAAWRLDRQGRTPESGGGDWSRALMLSNRESDDLAESLDTIETIRSSWGSARTSARKRLASRCTFLPSLAVLTTVEPECGTQVALEVKELDRCHGGLAPTAFVNGTDLIQMGAIPGPHFKGLLHALYDDQLEGRFAIREEALAAAMERLNPRES